MYDAPSHGAECTKCPLRGVHTPVPATPARSTPKLAIVGEGPGGLEVNRGVPFVGPSGHLLDAMLKRAGFDRQDAWITNSQLCRGFSDTEKERAGACCSTRLTKELEALPPSVPILSFGGTAAHTLLGKKGILRIRGFVWTVAEVKESQIKSAIRSLEKKTARDGGRGIYVERADNAVMRLHARKRIGGRTVIPAVHPAMILRGADGYTSVLYADLKRAVRLAKGEITHLETEESYVEVSDPEAARQALAKLGPTVTYDVETNGTDVFRVDLRCASVSDGEDERTGGRTVVLKPWTHLFAPVLQQAFDERTVVTHNGPPFDELVSIRHGIDVMGHGDPIDLPELGIVRKPRPNPIKRDDTLIAFHGCASHLKKDLGSVGAIYADCSPWKISFKESGSDEKGGVAKTSVWENDGEEMSRYSAADTRIDARVWHRMQRDLEPERRVYEHDMQLAYVCQRMQLNGFAFDKAKADVLSARLSEREAELIASMQTMLGDPKFSPSKPAYVRRALFQTLGERVRKETETGLAATDAEVLEALKAVDTPGGKLATLILRWRAAAKTRSTFLDGVPIGPDGRVHPIWKSYGTISGRLAARKPNLQNLVRAVISDETSERIKRGEKLKDILAAIGNEAYELETRVRELYVARPGYELIYFDLCQSEARSAAYLSGDKNFIASCESGDVHRANAIILFPEARELLEKDPKGRGKKFRDVAKNVGFGIMYLAELDTIYAFLCSQGFGNWITMQSVEEAFDRIHNTYPEYYAYCDRQVAFARQHGYLRSAYIGRKRWVGRRQSADSSKGYENTVANFGVQAANADLMNIRVIRMVPRLPPYSYLVGQVHDACIFEAKQGIASRLTKELIRETWEEDVVIPHNGLRWKMPIDQKSGECWAEL